MTNKKHSFIGRIPATLTRTQVPLPIGNYNFPIFISWISIGEISTTDIVLRLTVRRDGVDYIVAYVARTTDNTVTHQEVMIVLEPDDILLADMVTAVSAAIVDICITYEILEPESVWNGG